MGKGIIFAVFLVMLVTAVSGCTGLTKTKEQVCRESGGTAATGMCCLQTGDFPNLCLIGACGCSPDNSHEVMVCDCGDGMCFDGTGCVPAEGQGGDETCLAPAGESMMLSEARGIARNSECGDNLKGTATCNPDTGTWWIDLETDRQGCNPACVVSVVTGGAAINWRCTGVA